jgi:hypothetical protein
VFEIPLDVDEDGRYQRASPRPPVPYLILLRTPFCSRFVLWRPTHSTSRSSPEISPRNLIKGEL